MKRFWKSCTAMLAALSLTLPMVPATAVQAAVTAITASEQTAQQPFTLRILTAGRAQIKSIDKELVTGDVVIPEIYDGNYIVGIDDYAFSGSQITSLTLPRTVRVLQDYAFYNCPELEAVYVAQGNPFFASDDDGVLYNKDKTKLLMVPPKVAVSEYRVADGVEEIAYRAMYQNQTVTKLILPDSLKRIDACAAQNSGALTQVVFGSGVETIGNKCFQGCAGLRQVNLPESLTVIGEDAFNGCGLEQVSLPAVQELDHRAFGNCPNIRTVTVPSGIGTFGNSIFFNCAALEEVVIGEGYTSFGKGMFYQCTALKKVTLPQSLTTLPDRSFYGCSALEAVTLPQGLKVIGAEAFRTCRALGNVTIPDGVETIDEAAFLSCASMTSVVLPPSVKTVGDHAFGNYNTLTHLEVRGELEYIGLRAFPVEEALGYQKLGNGYYLQVGANPYYALIGVTDRNLTEFTFHADTRVIAGGVFKNCDQLERITIPSHIRSIGTSAFGECSALKEVTVGADGLSGKGTAIGAYAFEYCRELTEIHLGSGVTSVGDYAFRSCSALETLELPDSVTGLGIDAVDQCTALKVLKLGNGITELPYGWLSDPEQLTTLVLSDQLGMFASELGELQSFENLNFNIWGNGKYIPTKTNPYGYFAGPVDSSVTDMELHPDTRVIMYDAFCECTNLTGITLPEGLQRIEAYAFYGCTGLTGIHIPDSVTHIGEYTFSRSGLKSVTLSGKLDRIYANTFYGCKSLTEITIPSGVTAIGTGAFQDCTSLKTVSIADGITVIGKAAFLGCDSLTGFQIPEGVTEIADTAFSGCKSLEGLVIPEGVTAIGNSAFVDCGFEKVVIPDTVTAIGDFAFSGASCGTEPVYIGKSVAKMGTGVFKEARYSSIQVHEDNPCFTHDEDGTLYNKDMTVLMAVRPNLQGEYTVRETVKKIEAYAFYESIVKKVVIHDGVETIGREAFRGSFVRNVVLPKGLKRLEDGMFAYCSALWSVRLPEALEYIGADAFCCSGIQYAAIPAGVEYIGGEAFCFVSLGYMEFMGKPPYISPTAFDQTKTIAYYFTEEAAWDSFAMQNYGGSITWKMQCKEHDYTQTVVEEPGCETMGTMLFACTRCEDNFTFPIPENGHSIRTEGKPATCTEEGWQTRYCDQCGEEYGTMYLPAMGHIPGEWVVTAEPTTEQAGWEQRHCEICQQLLEQRELPKLEKFVGGALGDNLTWKLSLDTGILTVSGEGDMMDGTKIAMPWDPYSDQIKQVILEEGVTSVGAYAFDKCTGITDVTLPQGLRAIEKYAFFGCSGLGQLDLPEGTAVLAEHAFSYCTALTEMIIPHSVTVIEKNLFVCCSGLETVTLHSGITAIGDSAFFGCSSLKALTIPEGVPTLGEKCLYKCAALQELTIPASVTSIGSFALYRCTGLQKLTFAGEAPAIAADAFKGVTATAVCPAQWADEAKQNYGGTITWRSAEEAVILPTFNLRYPTLTFEDVILINVYYEAADVQDVLEMGLITYSSAVEDWNVETAETVTAGYQWSEQEGLYCATTQGIAAKDMGNEIYFAVYAKLVDGSYAYSRLVSYSPQTYAYAQLTTSDPDMRSMVVAMLNYGAAAQDYFQYHTDTPVNAGLTEEQLAMAEDYRADMVAAVESPSAEKQGDFTNNGGYTRRYPTVSFEGAFSINYYYTPSTQPVGDVTMYYWNQEAYDTAQVLTAENATAAIVMQGSEEYHAAVEGIAAKDLDQGVYVCFVYSDGTTQYASGVLAYSIGTYCAAQASGNSSAATLAKATAVYGYYAKNLLG